MFLHDFYNYLSDLPRWNILLAILVVGYFLYYLIEVVKTPFLAVSDGPFKKYLYHNVPMLRSKFWPTFWCVESRAQTVIPNLWREKFLQDLKYRRELLTLKDGGEIALDWSEKNCKDDSPLILILPGLTGASQAEYIKCMVKAGNRIGARIVVLNNRGLGGVALKTPRLYCAAVVEDLSEVVQHLSNLYPNSKIGATGISLGGLILGNYLSRHSEEARKIFTACQIISVPWNMHKGCASLEKPHLNKLLNKSLASSVGRMISQHEILFENNHVINLDSILKSQSIREIDLNFTSKHFGFEDVNHYYNAGSLHNKMHKVSVPLLCLNAADDPFQPLEAIPTRAAEESSHVAILVTSRGGHVGFMEGLWPKTGDEYMARFFAQYYKSTLFNEEFKKVSEEMMKIYPRPAFYDEPAVFAPNK